MLSERIKSIAADCRNAGMHPPENTYKYDLHRLALGEYRTLEKWEKTARATAGALANRPVHIRPYDELIGRYYYNNDRPCEALDPDLDCYSVPRKIISGEIPDFDEFSQYQLTGNHWRGHMAWNYNTLLKLGTNGIKALYRDALKRTADKRSMEFYTGVLITLDALEEWNDKHTAELEKRGMDRQAQVCRRSVRYPAETFREAIQTTFMQYVFVMNEFPAGGNGLGRLDYFLWPYLKADLRHKRCTLQAARELIDELFIRIDEPLTNMDGFVSAIVVGGTSQNGDSAVNPLTYMMIESITELGLTHPSVYVRIPEEPSQRLLKVCTRYIREGGNRGQLLSDKNIIKALTDSGVSYRDAVDYYCGGCMEIGVQGMNCDYLFNDRINVTKIVELSATGGLSLNDGRQLSGFRAKGLVNCKDFEEFYADFISEAKRIVRMFLRAQDIYGEYSDKEDAYPCYFLSSMLEDALAEGRGMHGGGARYYDYGQIPMGLPNAADYLYAVKKAVYDEQICTAGELITALRDNFSGHEMLRLKLKNIPKYGRENEEADQMMRRLCNDFCGEYLSYVNRLGGRGKAMDMTFIWAAEMGSILSATADGNFAGKPIAHGLTPQSASMTDGITAAINSCTNVDFTKFNGGASTMWDLDPAWATDEIIETIFTVFFQKGGQILQGNVISADTLRHAQSHPEEYPDLVVRVGGFSARFVNLPHTVQDEIIERHRHGS